MDTNINSRNRAQILVLFAVSLVALIALTALVLDGGMLFLTAGPPRRQQMPGHWPGHV